MFEEIMIDLQIAAKKRMEKMEKEIQN